MLKNQVKITITCVLALLFSSASLVLATGAKLGMHVLNVHELDEVRQIYPDQEWRYVTIPLTLADLERPKDWQKFMDRSFALRLIPIVRLNTRFDPQAEAWQIPTRQDIVLLSDFLSGLNWHQAQRLVIVFNEVNHAKEWGGQLDPASYVEALKFASQWLRSENKGFEILPAAMDLAANNSAETREAFNYLQAMWQAEPELADYFDHWNSHSYPNPGFSASPRRLGQNSMRGFLYELDWLKRRTGRDFAVYITETGWSSSHLVNYSLSEYYLYSLRYIWSDSRVKAVTPFIMKGSPGPFASFSFLDAAGQPTIHTFALQKALKTFDILDL